jgi:hypothetical protein
LVDTFFSALLDSSPNAGNYDLTNAHKLDAKRYASFAHLLVIVAWCWIAYVVILFLLDYVLVARTPQLYFLPQQCEHAPSKKAISYITLFVI